MAGVPMLQRPTEPVRLLRSRRGVLQVAAALLNCVVVLVPAVFLDVLH